MVRSFALLLALLPFGCQPSDPVASPSETDSPAVSQTAASADPLAEAISAPIERAGATKARDRSEEKTITLYDHGLGVNVGTFTVPTDWQHDQDIATDPNTGATVRHLNRLTGPHGELIQTFPTATYNSMYGRNFGDSWTAMVREQLGEAVATLSFGAPQPDPAPAAAVERLAAQARAGGLDFEALTVPVRGQRQGHSVRGSVYLIHYFHTSQMPGVGNYQAGTYHARLTVAPPAHLATAERVQAAADQSYRATSAYQARTQQLQQQSAAQYQQRMAQRQSAFNAHQQRMQAQSQASDQRYNRWMQDFRSSGSANPAGSDYSTHNAYIDGIQEQQTFQDPYSGQQVQQPGQYDHYYTDGQGSYYGTDDANFDPNTLPGNWQRTEPLRPQY